MLWVDSTAPDIRSAVVSGAYGREPHSDHGHEIPLPPSIDTIADALNIASDILTRLTGFTVHPALEVEEDFVQSPTTLRLYPSFYPVRMVLLVHWTDSTGQFVQVPVTWVAFAGAIYFSPDCSTTLDQWHMGMCGCRAPQKTFLRVAYQASSTITASARQAVIALAHDIWLDTARCSECELPARTTSVNREGLSYNVSDSGDSTSELTGLPSVDAWVRAVNPHKAARSSAVYTPDSPPPVVRAVRVARPAWSLP